MTDDQPDRQPLDEDQRIDSLQRRIDAASDRERARTEGQAGAADPGYRLGNRVLADLIAGVGGGALIGWVVDRWLGTSPWFLLGLLFLGMAVAFRNIMRISGGRRD